jgi:hypothetical protein
LKTGKRIATFKLPWITNYTWILGAYMYSHFTTKKKKKKQMKKKNKKRPDPYRPSPPFILVFSTPFYFSFLNLSLNAEHTMHLSCVMVIGREGSTDNPLNKPTLQWPTTTQHYCSPHSNAHPHSTAALRSHLSNTKTTI